MQKRHSEAFRDNYLAAITTAALLLISFISEGQIYTKTNNGYGNVANRGSFDSTLFFPTACGVPTDTMALFSQGFGGKGEKLHKYAIYGDSCGHLVYLWDPSAKTWSVIGSGSGSADSTSSHAFYTKYRSDTSRTNIYTAIQALSSGKKDNTDSVNNTSGYASRARVQARIDSLSLALRAALVANSFGAKFLGADIWANRPVATSGPGIFLSTGPDSTGFWYTNGVAYTRYTIDPNKSFGLYTKLDGGRGIKLLRAADSSLYIKGIVDSTGGHIFLNPDSTVSFLFGGGISDSGFAVLYAPLSNVPIAKVISGSKRLILVDTSAGNIAAIETRGRGDHITDSMKIVNDARYTQRALNLSDLGNAGTARTNLGLGTSAVKDIPSSGNASTSQVVYGTDTRLSDSRAPSGSASGDLTGSYPGPTVAANAITNAKAAQMAPNSMKGNNTGSTANAADLTVSQAMTMLGAQATSQKDQPSGYPSLNSFGKVPTTELPGILFQYNVQDYGAVGDGTTDCTSAINSCIAAAQSVSQQSAIIFPQGNYKITGALTALTRPLLIYGVNANILASGGGVFDIFTLLSDSIRMQQLKFVGSSTNQRAVNCNGHKFFDIKDCDFSGLNVGMRFANTSGSFNAGNITDCNFYNNNVGVQSDTSGEYVTVHGGLMTSNTVGVLNDGGNNIYDAINVNSNHTGFRFTGGTNNSHGLVSNCNVNHNDSNFSAIGANLGENLLNNHMFDGKFSLVNCVGWIVDGGQFYPSGININICTNCIIQNAQVSNSNGGLAAINYNGLQGAIRWINNHPGPTDGPLPDSLGGRSTRLLGNSGVLDFGASDVKYISLGADSTITSIIHPTLNRRYRIEVIPNGHTLTVIDNSYFSGSYNTAAALNVVDMVCIDAGADPRFIGSISQPGILVSRVTNNIGWNTLVTDATSTGTISGNNITKNTGSTSNWSVSALTDKVLMGDGYCTFKAVTGNDNIIYGLTTNPASYVFTTINYGIFLFAPSNIDIIENGTVVGGATSTWANGDWFRVKVTGSTVTYEKSTNSGSTWTAFYTSLVSASTFPLYPKASIRAQTTFTDARIFGTTVINNLSDQFRVKYSAAIAATPPAAGATSTKIFSQTANGASVTNTTSATSILGTGVGTNVFPANSLVAGSTVVWHGYIFLSADATPGTLTITSTATSASWTITPPASITNRSCELTITTTILTTGSPGTCQTAFTLNMGSSGSSVIASNTTTSITTTSSATFGITATWQTALTNNGIQTLPPFTLKIE